MTGQKKLCSGGIRVKYKDFWSLKNLLNVACPEAIKIIEKVLDL